MPLDPLLFPSHPQIPDSRVADIIISAEAIFGLLLRGHEDSKQPKVTFSGFPLDAQFVEMLPGPFPRSIVLRIKSEIFEIVPEGGCVPRLNVLGRRAG